jgi:hypothetical protein
MATVTVDATYQGVIQRTDGLGATDWSATRDAIEGTNVTTYTTATTQASIGSRLFTGRVGITQIIIRTFLFFDLDSIPTEAKGNITAATLKVLGDDSNDTADTIIVQGTAWGGDGTTSTLSTSDFNNLTFGTPFSSEKTSWDTSFYNDYTLNVTSLELINAFDYLNCAVIEHDYDYSNTTPPNPTDARNDVRFLDATNKIKLEITYPDPGYGNTVIGVAPADIGSVIGVDTGDIETVIGV